MAAAGACATFLPQELLVKSGCEHCGPLAVLLVQTAGALYLGFAILNWMARTYLMGGIYGRPVALGNLLHFAVVAITLWKAVIGGSLRTTEIVAACLIYSVFAAWFGFAVFTHPIQNQLESR